MVHIVMMYYGRLLSIRLMVVLTSTTPATLIELILIVAQISMG